MEVHKTKQGVTLARDVRDSRVGGRAAPQPEPWYRLAELAILPPLKLWFNWRFEGLESVPSKGPVLAACNHISYLDPLADGYFLERAGRRPRFLAKAELFDNPFLRLVLRGTHQIPVQRGTGDPAPVVAATKALENGEAIVVYPEGTVTTNPDFTPMKAKTGVARLSLAAGVPVLPLAIWGAQYVWQRSGPVSLRFGRPIWLKAGHVLDFSQYADRADDPVVLRKVTDEVMETLGGLVDDLRADYPRRWSR
ncbi:MAG: lysophospholipid acyltransferase family protein [Actinomycetota bacterium]